MNAADKRGFTLVELLVVIAIIGILSSFILAAVVKSKVKARRTACGSSLKQVAAALEMYSGNHEGLYPLATGMHDWGDSPPGWMEQLYPFARNKEIYKCPSFPKGVSEYHFFLSTRAAYIHAGNKFASTNANLIKFASLFVMGGDTNYIFPEPDCDKDDYTQICLGWTEDAQHRKPYHSGGLNVIFADTHVRWLKAYDAEKMTFRYKTISDW